jgi:4-carboxymuconolactone decarboxylase
MVAQSHRYEVDLDVLKQVGGPDYAAPVTGLQGIAPDLARFIVEFAYGDVMSRPALDLKTPQISTVAALAAKGNAQPQLKEHIDGALNVGWSPQLIIEAILLNAVHAGFPTAVNGVFAARDVFEQHHLMPIAAAGASHQSDDVRYTRGWRALEQVSGESAADIVRSLEPIAPELARFIMEFAYGDIISRPGLDYRTKELVTVALLTALGTARP